VGISCIGAKRMPGRSFSEAESRGGRRELWYAEIVEREMENGKSVEETAAQTGEEPFEGAPEQAGTASEELNAALQERDQLAQEKAELRDMLLRRQAEFENFRRRIEREKAESADYAAMEAVRQLLPILDDFERALKVDAADKEYVRGIELIYQRLFETLQKLGLEPIEAVGRIFDPYLHHAVDRVQNEEAE
jgi:molecular chaperone GrpE